MAAVPTSMYRHTTCEGNGLAPLATVCAPSWEARMTRATIPPSSRANQAHDGRTTPERVGVAILLFYRSGRPGGQSDEMASRSALLLGPLPQDLEEPGARATRLADLVMVGTVTGSTEAHGPVEPDRRIGRFVFGHLGHPTLFLASLPPRSHRTIMVDA